MGEYKVTFIIPLYNAEKYIKECIESLIRQTLENKEIIIVNDGSTDSSLEVIQYYLNKYEYIRVINQKNEGPSVARNMAMKAAKGKYIQFIDADDFVNDSNYAMHFYILCEKYNLDIIRGQYKLINENLDLIRISDSLKTSKQEVVMHSRDYFNKCIENQIYEVVPVLGFYRKSFLEKNNLNFVPNVTMEDHEFTLKCLTKDKDCRLMEVTEPFYMYRKHKDSITTTYKQKNINDILFNMKSMKEYIDCNNFSDALKINCNKAVSALFYQATSIYGRMADRDRKQVRPLFEKAIIKYSVKYAYNSHQKIKFLVCYFLWPAMDIVYSFKRLIKK